MHAGSEPAEEGGGRAGGVGGHLPQSRAFRAVAVVPVCIWGGRAQGVSPTRVRTTHLFTQLVGGRNSRRDRLKSSSASSATGYVRSIGPGQPTNRAGDTHMAGRQHLPCWNTRGWGCGAATQHNTMQARPPCRCRCGGGVGQHYLARPLACCASPHLASTVGQRPFKRICRAACHRMWLGLSRMHAGLVGHVGAFASKPACKPICPPASAKPAPTCGCTEASQPCRAGPVLQASQPAHQVHHAAWGQLLQHGWGAQPVGKGVQGGGRGATSTRFMAWQMLVVAIAPARSDVIGRTRM